jgi:4-aminobutyrate--pyruvate transaminase
LSATNEMHRKDVNSYLHGFSSLSELKEHGPHVIVKGEGIYIVDQAGNRYLEGNSGLWNAVLGFDDEQVLEAAKSQFDAISAYHTFFGRNSVPCIELADTLREIAPMDAGRVFFTNSGSEANDTAVKIAWMLNNARNRAGRRKIITRRNAYHGTTVMGANLTAREYNNVFGMPFGDVRVTDCPHYWRYGYAGENESAYLDRIIDNLRSLIESEGPESIAAFIAEPFMGAGGVVIPPKGYFPRLQEVLSEYEILLIADEVITGLGRSGELWGSQTFDIKPDIITTSKCLTAGYYPVGAVIPSRSVMHELDAASAELDEFPHGFTTAGNPVGGAIGKVVVDKIIGSAFKNLQSVAPRFQERLERFKDHEFVAEVRCIGLAGSLEIVSNKETKQPFPSDLSVSDRIARQGFKEGIIVRPIGTAVVFAPPFIITEDQIDELFDAFERTFNAVCATLG